MNRLLMCLGLDYNAARQSRQRFLTRRVIDLKRVLPGAGGRAPESIESPCV